MLTFNVKDIKQVSSIWSTCTLLDTLLCVPFTLCYSILFQKNRPPHPVTLFHFKEWPMDGVPPVDALLAMMGEIQKCQAGKEKPPIVMCK